jgi:hypothetical protein
MADGSGTPASNRSCTQNGPTPTGNVCGRLLRSDWLAAVRGPYATAAQERPTLLGSLTPREWPCLGASRPHTKASAPARQCRTRAGGDSISWYRLPGASMAAVAIYDRTRPTHLVQSDQCKLKEIPHSSQRRQEPASTTILHKSPDTITRRTRPVVALHAVCWLHMIFAIVTPPKGLDLPILTVTGQMQRLMTTGGRGPPAF